MSLQSLIAPAAGQSLLLLKSSKSLSSYQKFNLCVDEFIATPGTPIVMGANCGLLYEPADASVQPSAVNLYWQHVGGILGSITVSIRSANNLVTYASAVLNVITPVYPTQLTIALPFPTVKTPLKLVVVSDTLSNATVIPLAVEFL